MRLLIFSNKLDRSLKQKHKSWCTCTNGGDEEPPNDVAHTQFQSRIAFKLVWCPPEFNRFVLVDDVGRHLATGVPNNVTDQLPDVRFRMANYELVKGGRYGKEAERVGTQGEEID